MENDVLKIDNYIPDNINKPSDAIWTSSIFGKSWGAMKNSSQTREHDTHRMIVDMAERLFSQIGFQKTTIADIAHGLRMSPANVYRFFSAKSEINEAVGRRLLSEIEGAVEEIVKKPGTASGKLRVTIAAIEKANEQRFLSRRKLHELVETAFDENWHLVHDHNEKINKSLMEIIAQGAREGEFSVTNYELSAILVRSACIPFCHPRLMVECAQDPEPTVDQVVDFCLAALARDNSDCEGRL
jgi:AcrR family transcriptional regulator